SLRAGSFRQGIEFGLKPSGILPAPRASPRTRRVDTEGMFGDVIAVRRDHPECAWSSAESAHHFGNRMGNVIAAGPAEIRQPTSDRQSARIILGKPDLLAGNLHDRGKATVEIEEANVRKRSSGHVECCPSAAADRRG